MKLQKDGIHDIVTQGLSIMIICIIIEFVAGGFLSGMNEYFTVIIPALAIMTPPLLDLRGNVNGALASRLGTGLNAGLIKPRLRWTKEIKVNLLSSLILSFLASSTIGIISYGLNLLVGTKLIGLLNLLGIAIIAGVLSGIILAVITTVVAVFTFVHGWDPDNVVAPLMATVGDFTTIISLFMAVLLVG
jgi:mgtE-like transporter